MNGDGELSYYAHRKFVVQVKGVAQEDGTLHTIESDHTPVNKGNLILTDEHNIDFPVSEEYFNKHYVKVEKVEEESKLSNFNYDQIAQGYAAMAELSQEEDEDYIKKMQDMVSGKPL